MFQWWGRRGLCLNQSRKGSEEAKLQTYPGCRVNETFSQKALLQRAFSDCADFSSSTRFWEWPLGHVLGLPLNYQNEEFCKIRLPNRLLSSLKAVLPKQESDWNLHFKKNLDFFYSFPVSDLSLSEVSPFDSCQDIFSAWNWDIRREPPVSVPVLDL